MNIKLVVQYDGTKYSGWQIQKNANTIQQIIQDAIFQLTGENTDLVGSGRTDAGVHALAQVANFNTNTRIKPDKLAYAINRYLPDDIKIINSCLVAPEFHARFSAISKTYEYNFYASEIELPLFRFNFARVRTDFDYELAKKYITIFEGTHDFSGFCSADNQSKNTIRTINYIDLVKTDEKFYKLIVNGNGFLYNMVRIIAGTIIDIGCGIIDGKNLQNILDSKDRNLAGKTASACGLCLKEVIY